MQTVEQWEARHTRPYFACGPARSATDVVWRQALRAERSAVSGGHAAALLWDLQSFFDTVDLDLLWEKAVRKGFPLDVLRVALNAYTAPRAVQTPLGRADPVRPTRGVAPGCTFAKALVHLYYLEDIDAFVEKFSSLT